MQINVNIFVGFGSKISRLVPNKNQFALHAYALCIYVCCHWSLGAVCPATNGCHVEGCYRMEPNCTPHTTEASSTCQYVDNKEAHERSQGGSRDSYSGTSCHDCYLFPFTTCRYHPFTLDNHTICETTAHHYE